MLVGGINRKGSPFYLEVGEEVREKVQKILYGHVAYIAICVLWRACFHAERIAYWATPHDYQLWPHKYELLSMLLILSMSICFYAAVKYSSRKSLSAYIFAHKFFFCVTVPLFPFYLYAMYNTMMSDCYNFCYRPPTMTWKMETEKNSFGGYYYYREEFSDFWGQETVCYTDTFRPTPTPPPTPAPAPTPEGDSTDTTSTVSSTDSGASCPDYPLGEPGAPISTRPDKTTYDCPHPYDSDCNPDCDKYFPECDPYCVLGHLDESMLC